MTPPERVDRNRVDEEVRWRVAVDTGGTFTDCLATAADGRRRRAKILSSSSLRFRLRGLTRPDPDHLWVETDLDLPEGWRRTERGVEIGASIRLLAGEDGSAPGRSITDRSITVIGIDPPGRLRCRAVEGSGVVRSLKTGRRRAGTWELVFVEPAPVVATRLALGVWDLPPLEMRLATTRGTNALLEERGGRVLFVVTRGFGDLLRIGDQSRLELFDPIPTKADPLHAEVLEIDERLAADGSVIRELDPTPLASVDPERFDAAAVCFLHADLDDRHERSVERMLLARGLKAVSRSSRVSPIMGFLDRARTTVVDAYLAPVLGPYLDAVAVGLSGRPEAGDTNRGSRRLLIMNSGGGLVGRENFFAKDSLLSGPAGGVVGATAAAGREGLHRILTFDMGGTSADTACCDGGVDHTWKAKVGPARLATRMVRISTVAAGGGSICGASGSRLTVGPHSAGADPGPACYGAGGPLTLTDVNLLLGRIELDAFEIPLDPGAAERRAEQLDRRLRRAGIILPREGMLEAYLRIADETMALALIGVATQRGLRCRDLALVGFGGAAGQHVCSLAERLGVTRVLVPSEASILSAYGLSRAARELHLQEQVAIPLGADRRPLMEVAERLVETGRDALVAEGVARDEIRVASETVDLRREGQELTLEVPLRPPEEIGSRLADRFFRRFGYRPEDRPVEVQTVRVRVEQRTGGDPLERSRVGGHEADAAQKPSGAGHAVVDRRRAWDRGRWEEVPVVEPGRGGGVLAGPMLIRIPGSGVWLPVGWRARTNQFGDSVLERDVATQRTEENEEQSR